MELLGIGPLEALFILLIALVVVGPRDLAQVARSAGRMLNRLYRSEAWRQLSEASRNLRTLPNRLAREAALEELDQVRKDLREEVTRDLRADLGLEQPQGAPPADDSSPGQPGVGAPPDEAGAPTDSESDRQRSTPGARAAADSDPELPAED